MWQNSATQRLLLFLLHFHAIAPAAIVNNMVRITAIAILPDAEQEPIVSAVTKEKLYAYLALALGMMEKTKWSSWTHSLISSHSLY